MIDKLSYDDVQTISNELKSLAQVIDKLVEGKGVTQLEDFSATVEGYSKFLENTIEINKDADRALQELKESIK